MARKAYPEHIRLWMTSYLTGTLCPALGIEPIMDEIEMPTLGVKSYVLLVRPRDAKPFVLRCMPKISGAVSLMRNAELVQSHHLPMPRVIYSAVSREHFREHGFGVIVEELIEGDHPEAERMTAHDFEKLGEAFAKLHSVTSMKWGVPGRERGGSYFDRVVLKKMKNRLYAIAKSDSRFERAQKKEIVKFAKSFRKSWDGGPPFSLTHDKINRGNVLISSDAAQFIDLESLCYGSGAKDFTAALEYFCADQAAEEKLKEAYFARLDPGFQRHFETHEALYRVWFHLGRWAARAHDLQRKRNKGRKPSPSAPGELKSNESEKVKEWMERVAR